VLVFPWVEGPLLSEIVDDRTSALFRQAAGLAADLHRLPLVPETLTTAEMMVDETRARCDRLRNRWPEVASISEPSMAALEEAVTLLDPADPAPVHGDMWAGQFVWTGDRLVLLDLDLFGYADPAFDAGYFLAQWERRCLCDATLAVHARHGLTSFRDAYLAAMPQVSPRNVSFYRGLALVRKIYTVCRQQPAGWLQLVPQLGDRARAALEELTPVGHAT
jgi:aminoglycoside phosphotransferase (APT) family kinase protein